MKNFAASVFALLLLLSLAGCAPDLTVRDVDPDWDGAAKSVTATIANIGSRDAGAFLVYFYGVENPVSPNHLPMVSRPVTGLARGAAIPVVADFLPEAHPDNNNLGRIYKIKVMVDPKDMVKESNETNNTMEKPVSTP